MLSFSGVTLFCLVSLPLSASFFVSISFSFFSLEMSLCPSIFVPLPFSLSMESTSYFFSFRMVFFYLLTTGWIFDISLCENLINQSIKSIIGTTDR